MGPVASTDRLGPGRLSRNALRTDHERRVFGYEAARRERDAPFQELGVQRFLEQPPPPRRCMVPAPNA
jgi:hypothetical protein